MLDANTKRRIDTARDILVGKVPDPKSQVEQITIALIYKFMDDMDAEAEELGGKRKFFAKEFARYGWAKLMRSGLGGHETLNLYAEAITKMPENPGIPPLFRDIFKNAYLPYRDPETLREFLKVIDEFVYDHSERLGDAFEYLLSVLGSQGDAGQFRTPRHIIDFMVAIINPQKTETVLDPACGTAGFLISSYKHILKANIDKKGHSTLTPAEKGRLAKNFKGYDISPDMVRLSLVNMYLHGFADPHIYEYDTLTNQDRWNEYADVILANPPFMSPKGGIKPHNRFSVQSKRSEVLFVDYMAEHLTPNGRAGIIVPEGIIFQSQNAYVQLRKMLVENSLVAVISLPAGVFNPYSGVKTSILVLDKSLAKQVDTVGFFKIENDGFDLGAQRRPIVKNDLPQALSEISEYLSHLRTHKTIKDFKPTSGLVVSKEKIIANGDYNLSGERYKKGRVSSSKFPSVELGEVCELVRGVVFAKEDEVTEGGVKVLRANNIDKNHFELDLTDVKQVRPKIDFSENKKLKKNDIFICLASGSKDHIGKVTLIKEDTGFYFGGFMGAIRVKVGRLEARYLLRQLTSGHFNDYLRDQIAGANINNLGAGLLYRFKIPLPPLEVQKEIVAEIEGYQKVIDGARAVVDNYRPHIQLKPEWPIVEVGEIAKIEYGFTASASDEGNARFIRITDIAPDGTLRADGAKYIKLSGKSKEAQLTKGDILVARTGATYGKTMLFEEDYPAVFASFLIRLKFSKDEVNPRYYWIFAQSKSYWNQARSLVTGGGQPQFNGNAINKIKFPLPPLTIQKAIVDEIENEQSLIAANRDLIKRFEMKIRTTLDHIWGSNGQKTTS